MCNESRVAGIPGQARGRGPVVQERDVVQERERPLRLAEASLTK